MKNQSIKEQIIEEFKKDPGYKNVFSMPKIEKVVVNSGIGKGMAEDQNFINIVSEDLKKITGQKPKVTLAKKAISGFKVRQNAPVGLQVTLRGKKMDDFLKKFINVVIPRIRDFRGLKKKSIDKFGNLNIGMYEHIVFPEIKPDQVKKSFSLQVNIKISEKDPKIAKKLYKKIGFIFQGQE